MLVWGPRSSSVEEAFWSLVYLSMYHLLIKWSLPFESWRVIASVFLFARPLAQAAANLINWNPKVHHGSINLRWDHVRNCFCCFVITGPCNSTTTLRPFLRNMQAGLHDWMIAVPTSPNFSAIILRRRNLEAEFFYPNSWSHHRLFPSIFQRVARIWPGGGQLLTASTHPEPKTC